MQRTDRHGRDINGGGNEGQSGKRAGLQEDWEKLLLLEPELWHHSQALLRGTGSPWKSRGGIDMGERQWIERFFIGTLSVF